MDQRAGRTASSMVGVPFTGTLGWVARAANFQSEKPLLFPPQSGTLSLVKGLTTLSIGMESPPQFRHPVHYNDVRPRIS